MWTAQNKERVTHWEARINSGIASFAMRFSFYKSKSQQQWNSESDSPNQAPEILRTPITASESNNPVTCSRYTIINWKGSVGKFCRLRQTLAFGILPTPTPTRKFLSTLTSTNSIHSDQTWSLNIEKVYISVKHLQPISNCTSGSNCQRHTHSSISNLSDSNSRMNLTDCNPDCNVKTLPTPTQM